MTLVEDASTLKLNEITSSYLEEFQDKETRHIYVDEFLNAKIATQIKVLREQKGWNQQELAEKVGMKQERISVLEDVNYSAWTLATLRRLAEVFDLRINVSFEDFGSFLKEFEDFNKENLQRTSFDEDTVFKKESKPKAKVLRTDKFPTTPVKQIESGHYSLFYLTEVPLLNTETAESSTTSIATKVSDIETTTRIRRAS